MTRGELREWAVAHAAAGPMRSPVAIAVLELLAELDLPIAAEVSEPPPPEPPGFDYKTDWSKFRQRKAPPLPGS